MDDDDMDGLVRAYVSRFWAADGDWDDGWDGYGCDDDDAGPVLAGAARVVTLTPNPELL